MGDEIWKDVSGYEGFYQVSSIGRVRSLDRRVKMGKSSTFKKGKILKLDRIHKGYRSVCMTGADGKKRRFEIHVLVSRTFLGPLPHKHHAHHIDEDKLNNRVENLVYLDCHTHGHITHRGEKAHKAVLKEEQIVEIRDLLEQGFIQKEIAGMYGVCRSTIGEIKRGKTWTHVD